MIARDSVRALEASDAERGATPPRTERDTCVYLDRRCVARARDNLRSPLALVRTPLA
jgi:hypothetical protein